MNLVRDAADKMKLYRENPVAMVEELFGVEPDPWQKQGLQMFPHSKRLAMKACKGPGKTAYMAWLCWNFLLTRPHPKIAAVSISAENLGDNLWTEMAKWQHKSPLLQQAFQWTKTRIFSKTAPETWWMSARAWSKSADKSQQADTLAGLHADYMLFVLDESGGIPSAVMSAAEAALSTGIEVKLVQAGNPTHLEGPLYDACVTHRDMWDVIEITGDPDDPNRSPRISVDWAREQIRMYGAENPWVLVNVFGRFPPSSINALIGPDEVRDAQKRHALVNQFENAPKILGVDVAREGDDASVIFPRQGIASFKPRILRNVDSLQGAAQVTRSMEKWKDVRAVFVDNTGGFGAGWIDQLRALGRSPIGIGFADKASDPRYFNKRAEMYFNAVNWIKEGGCLPPVEEMIAELSTTTYSFKGDRMILEPKDQVKERLGRSPDISDAFALTFAQPVVSPQQAGITRHRSKSGLHYDPFAGM